MVNRQIMLLRASFRDDYVPQPPCPCCAVIAVVNAGIALGCGHPDDPSVDRLIDLADARNGSAIYPERAYEALGLVREPREGRPSDVLDRDGPGVYVISLLTPPNEQGLHAGTLVYALPPVREVRMIGFAENRRRTTFAALDAMWERTPPQVRRFFAVTRKDHVKPDAG